MALKLNGKTITDPLYGNIQLTQIESELVSTLAFQRLHNVKQLGLGHLVFPSAAYSRFSHSVGACVNADRILSAIESNHGERTFSDQERQAFRIAALFHDLGHYPFSHTTEHAIKRYFREGLYKPSVQAQGVLNIEPPVPEPSPNFLDHEETGNIIFLEDPQISDIFAKYSDTITKSDVQAAYLNDGLSTIISSDLDCDRLDYLKRTALHSGAPYGAVDVDFIISKATLDADGRYCFDRKATRAADHLLMSRFYDFMQIPYQKTVAALEWSLEESVIYLLRTKVLQLSEKDIIAKLQDGTWFHFDDGHLLELMRKQQRKKKSSSDDRIALDHLSSVLNRQPAKMVYDWECLLEIGNKEQDTKEELLGYKINDVCEKLSLDRRRFTVWKAPFKLSKAGPILQRLPAERADYSDEEEQQLIHILSKNELKARPLIDLQNTVSHHLAKLKYRVLRVYYLPSQEDPSTIKGEIRQQLAD